MDLMYSTVALGGQCRQSRSSRNCERTNLGPKHRRNRDAFRCSARISAKLGRTVVETEVSPWAAGATAGKAHLDLASSI